MFKAYNFWEKSSKLYKLKKIKKNKRRPDEEGKLVFYVCAGNGRVSVIKN